MPAKSSKKLTVDRKNKPKDTDKQPSVAETATSTSKKNTSKPQYGKTVTKRPSTKDSG